MQTAALDTCAKAGLDYADVVTTERVAADNVAADHTSLCMAADGVLLRPIVRVWRNERCLVVGKAIAKEGAFARTQEAFRRKGVPVIVRNTGGTVVPHGPGTLNVSVVRQVPGNGRSVAAAYSFLCDGIIQALGVTGVAATVGSVPGSYCDGDYNIVVAGRKIAGTAQRWKRARVRQNHWCVLAHASLAVGCPSVDLALVADFYREMGWRQPFNPRMHTSVEEVTSLDDDGRGLPLMERLAANLAHAFAIT